MFRKKPEFFPLGGLLISADIVMFAYSLIAGAFYLFIAALILLFVFILIYLYLFITIKNLRVTRSHNESAVEGEEFFVEVGIANFSYLPVFYVDVADTFLPGRMMSINWAVTESIKPRSVFEYTAHAYIAKKMGMYTVGPMELVVTDPFGMFSLRKTVELFTGLTVYPALEVPEKLSLMDNPLVKSVGEEIISMAGRSTDFRGQREYRREDPKNTIHWRATAKHGRLIVKEFDEDGITDVGIFTDYRRIALRGTGNLTTLELGLKSAASIGAAAARAYHRFSVSFIGTDGKNDIPFGTGVNHLHLGLQSMVSLGKPGKYSAFCRRVIPLLHAVRRSGTAVFIVNQTTIDTEEMEDIIKSCYIRGVKPVVVLINDRTFFKLFTEQVSFEKEAPGFQQAKERFEMAGAAVFTLSKLDVPADEIDSQSTPRRRDFMYER